MKTELDELLRSDFLSEVKGIIRQARTNAVRSVDFCRQFYKTYPIVNALRSQFNWTQYRLLIQIDNLDKREYYELEAMNNCWTVRELERQINSGLYERLLLSNDKEAVLSVARKERIPETPLEIIKDPMILEFLGLKREASYYEKDIEQALITHLQMYVNYYDREEKLPEENPTIGILLCANKNDTVVRYSLPKDNSTILASKYQIYLPSEEQLVKELKRELIERSLIENDRQGDIK